MRYLVLNALSMAVIVSGGLVLSHEETSASEHVPAFLACDEEQTEYVRSRIRQECGPWGGVAEVICEGHSIQILSITCNAVT